MATGSDLVDVGDAKAALDALSKEERDTVLSLPTHEAMLIIRLLVAFPGTRFVDPNTLVGP